MTQSGARGPGDGVAGASGALRPEVEAPTVDLGIGGGVVGRQAHLAGGLGPVSASALADTVAGGPRGSSSAGGPRVIGRYQISRRLGAGGMGTVYGAHDAILDREVAVKLLDHDDRPGRIDRLLREAQAMAKLSHPNVAQVYEAGTHEGHVFIAMELIHGTTLRGWLEGGARSIPAIIERFVAAGRGLAAAHAAGVVHRDFKPDNVLVGDDGRVVVVDFGVARLGRPLPLPRGGAGSDSDRAADPGLGGTHDGRIVGTPAYMSPEQWLGGTVDARSDQFSFAAALFEAVHGRRPFAGDNVVDLARNVLSGTIDAPRDRRAPAWLDRLLVRALQVHAERRFAGMEELLGALTRDRVRRRRRWIAACVGLAIAGGLGFSAAALRRDAPCVDAGEQIRRVWSGDRRAAIREALITSGAGYALATWDRIDDRLDDYAGSWAAEVREACEATRVREEVSEELLDRRMACLGTRLRAFEAVVDLFEREGSTAVDRAIEALAGLPTIELCADAERVRERFPPPPNQAIAAAVEVLRDRLAEIQTATDTGDPRRSFGALEALDREAEALGYLPVIAEVRARRGAALLRAGEPAGEALLDDAFRAAIACGHDEVALEVALALGLGVAGETKTWLVAASGLLDRIGATDYLRARYHYVRLYRACQTGACTESMAPLVAAIERHRQAVGDGHPTLAGLEVELANIHMLRGEVREAEAAYAAALALNESILGPNHPRLALSLGNLARLALGRNDVTAADAAIRRVREIVREGYEETHPYVIGLHRLESDLALIRGDADEAAAILGRVVAANGDRTTSTVVQARLRQALVLRLAGRRDEALAALRAYATLEVGPDDRVEGEAFRALLAIEIGEVAEARTALDQARLAVDSGILVDSVAGTYVRIAEAQILAAEGSREAAVRELEAVIAGAPSALAAEAGAALTRILAADPEVARRHAVAADAAYVDAGPAYDGLRRELAAFVEALPVAGG